MMGMNTPFNQSISPFIILSGPAISVYRYYFVFYFSCQTLRSVILVFSYYNEKIMNTQKYTLKICDKEQTAIHLLLMV